MSDDNVIGEIAPAASAEPPPAKPEPTGHCGKCGAIMPMSDTEMPNGPRGVRTHRLRVNRAARMGVVCGPVAAAYVYHVFFWGPLGPERDTMESGLPIDGNPGVCVAVLDKWEAHLRAAFDVTAGGATIVGAEQRIRVKIADWKFMGIR
jgi:hypothetical protein